MLRLYFELTWLRTRLTPALTPFRKTSNNQIPARGGAAGLVVGARVGRRTV